MKKFVAFTLCVMLVCLCISSAFASVLFSYEGTSTTFTRWGFNTNSDGETWELSWRESNLSNTLVAAIKIYSAPGVYASHTFYYSSKSTDPHKYEGIMLLASDTKGLAA